MTDFLGILALAAAVAVAAWARHSVEADAWLASPLLRRQRAGPAFVSPPSVPRLPYGGYPRRSRRCWAAAAVCGPLQSPEGAEGPPLGPSRRRSEVGRVPAAGGISRDAAPTPFGPAWPSRSPRSSQ